MNELDLQTATAIEDDEKSIVYTFALSVRVHEDWIKLVTEWDDLFRHDHLGYWARGVDHDEHHGWLVWVDDEKCRPGAESDHDEAIAAWHEERELPANWYRFDRVLALRAFEEGVKGWGVRWYEEGDAPRYDSVVQRALFGKEVYG